MNKSQEILSQVTVFSKYAKYIPELQRRETWEEIVNRNIAMHSKKYPKLKEEIKEVYQEFVMPKKVLPSMRSLQFAGLPIELNNSRIYNCAYMPVDHPAAFSETMFLLLGGTGVGYSVQNVHINQLPFVQGPKDRPRKFLVSDNIEGWADAVKVLLEAYFYGKSDPNFDFRDIRPKGARLITSGGKAPGPDPLRICLDHIRGTLNNAIGRKLSSLEVHDIQCHIADAVLAGGIRRAAMISLFDKDDMEMLTCKSGMWWELNPQRGRANNSAVLVRNEVTKEEFFSVWDRVINSHAGEPGVYWTNDKNWGTNPCKPLRSTILTDQGYITFEEALKKDSLKVYTPDGRLVSATKPFKTGENKEVYKITLSNGMYLYGTANHQHQTQDGKWKRVDELEVGERLAYCVEQRIPTSIDNVEQYEHGLLMGWLYGDGWNFNVSSRPRSKRAGLCFGVNEMDVVEQFEKMLNKKHKDHSQKPDTCKVISVGQKQLRGFDKTKDLGWLRTQAPEFKLGFIRAIFTADGSVRKQNNVELYSINRAWMETVGLILQEFGIRSTITVHNNARSYIASDNKKRNNKIVYKLNVHSGQFKRIGFLSKIKQDLVENQEDKGLYRRVDYETVVDIELDSIEDVYDITVNDDCHAFIDTGVSTHNCCEIGLRPNQFCNLTEINASDISSQGDLEARAKAASFIGTLQAGYTDFHYLRPVWQDTTEKDALLGVSMTGIGSGKVLKLDLQAAAKQVIEENKRVAETIGINSAARTTAVKPAGTTSLVVGSSSGIHAWHNDYYIRRMRVGKNEALYSYMKTRLPNLVEDCYHKPHIEAVMSFPQKAPEGALYRTEKFTDLLERVKKFNAEWVKPGHVDGINTHNVSCTISLKDNEWWECAEWMWENRFNYNGISVLPYDGGTYIQAPFEDITKEKYEEMEKFLSQIDLTQVKEIEDGTKLTDQVACSGNSCEIS